MKIWIPSQHIAYYMELIRRLKELDMEKANAVKEAESIVSKAHEDMPSK
jgi:hypothetical protein